MNELFVPATDDELLAFTTTYFADYEEMVRSDKSGPGPVPSELIFKLFEAGRAANAWRLIAALVDAAPSDDALGFVGAGVLEDLVRREADEATYRQIVERARVNARLRKALQTVWWGGEPDWFREELQKLGVLPDGRDLQGQAERL